MLIKQVHQKSVMFVAIDFLNYIFKFQANVSNRYHDLVILMKKTKCCQKLPD